ncbi:tripartite tricarboxylate transporter substrate binding protein [Pigmentiphaga soli]|uniref:Tripartite tricarboxylate transporter substrate binding protein n=1 Tax=Pigmentiphaga soli TaxID=1007095 RepID=A0ABP8H291_9BURK
MNLIGRLFAALAFAAVIPLSAMAGYPDKPVRIVVGFPPGGTDAAARYVAQKLSEKWKQAVIVDNRPGASGMLAAQIVAKSPPDGYTLMVSPQTSMVVAPALYPSMAYETLRDFTPITNFGTSPQVLVVRADSPIRTLSDISKERGKLGRLAYGSGGNGTSLHLAGALLNERLKLGMDHIPYKGESGALKDLLGGEIQLMFSNPPQSIEFIRSGRLRAIAVTSPARLPMLPDVPTVAESGLPNFDTATWIGFFAPAGLPPDVLRRVADDIIAVLHDPAAREFWQRQATELVGDSPEHFRSYVEQELVKWKKIVVETKAEVN